MLLTETRGRDLSAESIAEDKQTRLPIQEVLVHDIGR